MLLCNIHCWVRLFDGHLWENEVYHVYRGYIGVYEAANFPALVTPRGNTTLSEVATILRDRVKF